MLEANDVYPPIIGFTGVVIATCNAYQLKWPEE